MGGDDQKIAANNKFEIFLHNLRVIFFNIHRRAFIIGSIFLGNLLEKSAFLASKLGNGPLLEHGPVIEILLYLTVNFLVENKQ